MSAIPAFTPMEFGLVGLNTSTRTDRTTCIPYWMTRRRSRSFAAFDRMMSAIPAFTPVEFGLVGLITSRMMSDIPAITPMEFGLVGLNTSTRTMRIVLPMRSRTSPSTKPEPVDKPMEDPQFAGTNCLFLFRAKENRFACRWTRHQSCSPRTNLLTTPHKELQVAPGNHQRRIPVPVPTREQMNVEHWRLTHLPNCKRKNRCHDAVRVPRTVGKMQKRARLDITRRVRGVRPVELRTRRMQKRARLDIRQGVRPGPVITRADLLPIGAGKEVHQGARREVDYRGRPELMCRTLKLPVRPVRVLKKRRHCPSRSIC